MSRAVGSDESFFIEPKKRPPLRRSVRLAAAVVEGATRACRRPHRSGSKATFKSLEVVSQFLELTFRGMVQNMRTIFCARVLATRERVQRAREQPNAALRCFCCVCVCVSSAGDTAVASAKATFTARAAPRTIAHSAVRTAARVAS